jgi:predicted acetyltransferase
VNAVADGQGEFKGDDEFFAEMNPNALRAIQIALNDNFVGIRLLKDLEHRGTRPESWAMACDNP